MNKQSPNDNSANRRVLSLNREASAQSQIEERLHKVLANAGLGSRRLIEERIEQGEVRINGQVAAIGSSIRAGDRVELDGKAFAAVVAEAVDAQLLIYHKPEGEVTTQDDPEGRPTVFEKLPMLKGSRWVSIGRLDIKTTGLLLMTTDGELANAMMHPSSEVEREYICRIHGQVTEEMVANLGKGVMLEDGPAKFDEIGVVNLGDSHSWFRVVLHEGRNREVRRLWESQGVAVSRLKRIRYGRIELPRALRRGHWQIAAPEVYRQLRQQLQLAPAAQTLTLQPILGIRRNAKSNEFKPTTRAHTGYVNDRSDEARELRAFDFVRDDAPNRRKQKPGMKQNRRPARPSSSFPPGERPARFKRGDNQGNFAAATDRPARFGRGDGQGNSGSAGERSARFGRGGGQGNSGSAGERSARFGRGGGQGNSGSAGERSARFKRGDGQGNSGSAGERPARFKRSDNQGNYASATDRPARFKRGDGQGNSGSAGERPARFKRDDNNQGNFASATERPARFNRGDNQGNAAVMRSFSPGDRTERRSRDTYDSRAKGKPAPKTGARKQQSAGTALPHGFPSDHGYAQRYKDQPAKTGNAQKRFPPKPFGQRGKPK